jgi:hypothetical protein
MYESTPIWIDLKRRLRPTIFEMESCSTARDVIRCYLSYLRNLRHSLSILDLSIVSRLHPVSIRVDSFTCTCKELSHRKLCNIALNDVINTCFNGRADMMGVIPLFVVYCEYLYSKQQEKGEKDSVFEKPLHLYEFNDLDQPVTMPDIFEVDIDEHVWGAHNPYGFRLKDRRSVTVYNAKTNFDEMFTKLDEIGSMKLAVCLSPNVIKINKTAFTRKDSHASTAHDQHNKMSMSVSRIGDGIRLNV